MPHSYTLWLATRAYERAVLPSTLPDPEPDAPAPPAAWPASPTTVTLRASPLAPSAPRKLATARSSSPTPASSTRVAPSSSAKPTVVVACCAASLCCATTYSVPTQHSTSEAVCTTSTHVGFWRFTTRYRLRPTK